jgi:hypothetical protein
VPNVSI